MCVLSKCETNKPKLLCLNLQKATNSALVYNVILCMFLKLAIWIKDVLLFWIAVLEMKYNVRQVFLGCADVRVLKKEKLWHDLFKKNYIKTKDKGKCYLRRPRDAWGPGRQWFFWRG